MEKDGIGFRIRVYSKERGIRVLKEGVTLAIYQEKHPDAISLSKPPSITTLKKWLSNGSGKAIDGCSSIEPDGHCEHGQPSWLLAMGYI
jgi:hypothetical protein